MSDALTVVAMSGGVDSSVAALLLAREGHRVMGISMQVWDYRNNGGCATRATCGAPDDFTDARRVAATLGIPYYVFDFERTFRTEVIDRFVETYRRGETPNPCIDCNNRVKFRELRNRAEACGGTQVATGHYARIIQDREGFHLLRGADRAKDQSYFLYGLTQEELQSTVFPVGELTKAEVRELAREAGLVTASKPESQDICFVSGSVQDFLVRLGAKRAHGLIVTKDGTPLGSHDGIHNFTVGQRKGLHIGGHHDPLYVIHIDAESNRVTVGSRQDLERDSFRVGSLTWVAPGYPRRGARFEAMVQVRSRHEGTKVDVAICEESGDAEVRFLENWAPVSPGQAAVFYDISNQEVLGGGRIRPVSHSHPRLDENRA
jgi:tRNA-uridine 2-sulfurtransferase